MVTVKWAEASAAPWGQSTGEVRDGKGVTTAESAFGRPATGVYRQCAAVVMQASGSLVARQRARALRRRLARQSIDTGSMPAE